MPSSRQQPRLYQLLLLGVCVTGSFAHFVPRQESSAPARGGEVGSAAGAPPALPQKDQQPLDAGTGATGAAGAVPAGPSPAEGAAPPGGPSAPVPQAPGQAAPQQQLQQAHEQQRQQLEQQQKQQLEQQRKQHEEQRKNLENQQKQQLQQQQQPKQQQQQAQPPAPAGAASPAAAKSAPAPEPAAGAGSVPGADSGSNTAASPTAAAGPEAGAGPAAGAGAAAAPEGALKAGGKAMRRRSAQHWLTRGASFPLRRRASGPPSIRQLARRAARPVPPGAAEMMEHAHGKQSFGDLWHQPTQYYSPHSSSNEGHASRQNSGQGELKLMRQNAMINKQSGFHPHNLGRQPSEESERVQFGAMRQGPRHSKHTEQMSRQESIRSDSSGGMFQDRKGDGIALSAHDRQSRRSQYN